MPMVRDPETDAASRRWIRLMLAVIGLLPFAAIGLFILTFDPEIFRPQILAAVAQATGRELTIQGKLRLSLSLHPSIAADGVSLSNAPGGSRPDMARLQGLEVRIALIPLLQHQLAIDSLTLIRPDLLLETDTEGRANWRFREHTASVPPGPAAPRAEAGPRNPLFVHELHIEGGTLIWHDGPSNTTRRLLLHRADLQADAANTPIGLSLDAEIDGVKLAITGQVGSLNSLQGLSGTAWPVRLNIAAGEAKLAIAGSIAAPVQGKGYQLKLDASTQDLPASLTALAPLLPPLPRLPPLRDVSLTAEIADSGTSMPAISAISLRAGPSDLSSLLPGLRLGRLEFSLPKPDEPSRLTAEGNLGNAAIALLATIGAPAALLHPGPARPMPVDLALSAAGARLTVKGSIADARRLGGADLAVQATIPDLAAIAGLAGLPLPDLRDGELRARLTTPQAGPTASIGLKDVAWTQAEFDLAGDLAVGLTPRPSLHGTLISRRLNLDALLGPLLGPPEPAAAPQSAREPKSRRQTATLAGPRRLIPDDPIPFPALRLADADLSWRIAELIRAGEATQDFDAHLRLTDGHLTLDPFTATPPMGKFTASLRVDAARPQPEVALRLRSTGLDIGKLYAALGRQGQASGGDAHGQVELDIDLRGTGTTAQALAATATGHIGAAMVNGAVDNRILDLGLLGGLVRGINQGDVFTSRGTTHIRCLALRLDTQAGQGEMKALLLDSSTLTLDGTGGISLRDETLDLHLRTQLKLAGIGLALPVRVGGSLAAPQVRSDPSGASGALGRTVQGTAETATGALGLGNTNPISGADNCATQLAIARSGQAGTQPAAEEETTPRNQGRRPRPNLLQRLLPR